MDAWSPEQLKRMQLGGNDALNAFLKNYGVDKYTDIRDKYNSQAAEVYCSSCVHHLHGIVCSQWDKPDLAINTYTHLCHAVLQRQNQGRSRGQELHAPSTLSIQ